jgi:hypothetical protein
VVLGIAAVPLGTNDNGAGLQDPTVMMGVLSLPFRTWRVLSGRRCINAFASEVSQLRHRSGFSGSTHIVLTASTLPLGFSSRQAREDVKHP